MPNTILIPSAQNLPDGFCPQTWQSTVDAFAAAMRVTLPTSASQIVVSTTPPLPEYNDRIWFQVDGNNHVIAIKSFDSSTNTWERVDDIPYYFNDIGSANSLQITTGDSLNLLNDIGGRLFIIKASAANTSTTPTLTVDGCAATVIKKNGSDALEAGNIAAGMLCIIIYDGTQFQLLNPKYVVPAGSVVYYYNESPQLILPNDNATTEWNHGFSPNKPTVVSALAICTETDCGYAVGDEVDVFNLWAYIVTGGADLSAPAYSLSFDSTKVTLVAPNLESDAPQIYNKTSGALSLMNEAKWKVVFKASRMVPA